jgi:hypothetical protein
VFLSETRSLDQSRSDVDESLRAMNELINSQALLSAQRTHPASWPHAAHADRRRELGSGSARAIIAFLVLAIGLRLARWLLNYPMWCDETMLAANLLDRDWGDLAKPLAYRQVCPLGFLALEWLVVRLIGFSETSVRMVPLLCSLASVPLFHHLARRVLGLGTRATLVAVAMFATAEPLIRYAGEAKPYAADLLVSLVLMNLAVIWRQAPERVRYLWVMTAVLPLAVALSLPSVFVIATIACIALIQVTKERDARLIAAVAAFLVTATATLAAMAALGQYHTSAANRAYFLKYWAAGFPPSWRHPVALFDWLVAAHTGPLFAVPHGAIPGTTWLTALVFGSFVAGILVYRRRNPGTLVLLLLPFLCTLAAAALRLYPYGMSIRVTLYLVPSILLLAAAGTEWLSARGPSLIPGRRIIFGLTVALAVLGLVRLAHDLGHPYRTPWDRTAREFARWFWDELAMDSELVCVRSDLGIPFRPGEWAYDGSDQYLCYQRIYSSRHRKRLPPRWDAISTERPLRCVLLNRMPEEVPAFVDWIKAHRREYTLGEVRTFRASRGSAVEPAQTYVVCTFVPALTHLAAVKRMPDSVRP